MYAPILDQFRRGQVAPSRQDEEAGLRIHIVKVQTLVSFARIEVGLVLIALALVVGYQLLSGKINMDGLLLEKTATGVGGYSPARLQLLLLTLVAAFYFISEVVTSIHNGAPQFLMFPKNGYSC